MSFHMETLKASKYLALRDGETKNAQDIWRMKGKDKDNTGFEPKKEFNPLGGASGSKEDE